MEWENSLGNRVVGNPRMVPKVRKVGIISTYNIPCGIAEHAKYFVEHLQTPNVVFAESHPTPVYPDADNVVRCWTRDFNNYKHLLKAIVQSHVNIVNIQFEFSLYHNTDNLLKLLTTLKTYNIKTVITFHTMVDFMANCVNTLGDNCSAIIVTSKNMIRPPWIRKSVRGKMHFIPLPVPYFPDQDRNALRKKYNVVSNNVIASFGFLVDHKGVREVIEAVAEVKKYIPDIKYIIIGCHEGHPHGTYYGNLVETVNRLNLQDTVIFFDKYYPMSELFELMHLADLLVKFYYVAHPTSSGAAKLALASHRPLLCSSSPMFDDIPHDVAQRTPMGDVAELGRYIVNLLKDVNKRQEMEEKGWEFVQTISGEKIAQLHDEYFAQIRGY